MNVILPGILVFGLVVFIHELGHFLMAKACGVPVERFSVGFGPKLLGFTRGRTEYVIAAIPMGGYVKMAGDEMPEPGEAPDPDTFLGHPWWHRVLIALAGPGANFVLAMVLSITILMVGLRLPDTSNVTGQLDPASTAALAGLRAGDTIVEVDGRPVTSGRGVRTSLLGGEEAPRLQHPVDVTVVVDRAGEPVTLRVPAPDLRSFNESLVFFTPAVVGEVISGMPAYVAGVQEGDRILAVDGHEVTEWTDLTELISERGGQGLVLRVEREGRVVDLKVTPMKDQDGKEERGRIGIWPEQKTFTRKFGVVDAFRYGAMETVDRVALTAKSIAGLFLRPASIGQSISGPIAIIEMSGRAAQRDFSTFVNFIAAISIALMVFNLLPIPILDGGLVVMAVIEGIRRRPVPMGVQAAFQKVGFVLLGSLILFALLNDPLKMIKRNRAISNSKGQSVTTGDAGTKAPDASDQ